MILPLSKAFKLSPVNYELREGSTYIDYILTEMDQHCVVIMDKSLDFEMVS